MDFHFLGGTHLKFWTWDIPNCPLGIGQNKGQWAVPAQVNYSKLESKWNSR